VIGTGFAHAEKYKPVGEMPHCKFEATSFEFGEIMGQSYGFNVCRREINDLAFSFSGLFIILEVVLGCVLRKD